MTEGAPSFDSFYGYNGEDTSPVTGMQYLRARYYNTEDGRFNVADTYLGDISKPLTLNRYTYTVNNPVMHTDPTGHFLESIKGLIGSAAESAKERAGRRGAKKEGAGPRRERRQDVLDRVRDTEVKNGAAAIATAAKAAVSRTTPRPIDQWVAAMNESIHKYFCGNAEKIGREVEGEKKEKQKKEVGCPRKQMPEEAKVVQNAAIKGEDYTRYFRNNAIDAMAEENLNVDDFKTLSQHDIQTIVDDLGSEIEKLLPNIWYEVGAEYSWVINGGMVYYGTSVEGGFSSEQIAAINYTISNQQERFSNFSVSTGVSGYETEIGDSTITISGSVNFGDNSASSKIQYNYITNTIAAEYSTTTEIENGLSVTSYLGIEKDLKDFDDSKYLSYAEVNIRMLFIIGVGLAISSISVPGGITAGAGGLVSAPA